MPPRHVERIFLLKKCMGFSHITQRLLVPLVLLVSQAWAQSCSTAANSTLLSSALQKLPYCSHYVSNNTLVYIPAFGFPDIATTSMYQLIRACGHRFEGLYPPRNCSDELTRFFCTFLFRPCDQQGFPRAQCRSICDELSPACRSSVYDAMVLIGNTTFYSLLLPPCNKTETGNFIEGSLPELIGQPVFPVSVQYWNSSSGKNVSVACNAPALVSPLPDFYCYGIAIETSNRPDQPYCAERCPLPHVTRQLEQAFHKMMYIFGIIGTILCTLAIVLRVAIPAYRTYPSNLVLFLLFDLLIFSFNNMWPVFRNGGIRLFLCHRVGMFRDRPVRIQGAILLYTDVCKTCYWGVIALHTLVAVKWGAEYFNKKTMIASHVYAIGIPVLFGIIALASHAIKGAQSFLPFGYFGGIDVDHPLGSWREFPLYWAPLGFNIILSSICLILVLKTSIQRQSMGHAYKWSRNFRIFLFLLVLLFVEVWKWSYRLFLIPRTSEYSHSIYNYTRCSVFGPDCVRGAQQTRMAGVFVAMVFTPPIIVSALFMANSDLYRHWKFSLTERLNPYATSTTVSLETRSRREMSQDDDGQEADIMDS